MKYLSREFVDLSNDLEEANTGYVGQIGRQEHVVNYLISRGWTKSSSVTEQVLRDAAGAFACHSDYHGDAIVSYLTCMAEGKPVAPAVEPKSYKSLVEVQHNYAKKLIDRLVAIAKKDDNNFVLSPDIIDILMNEFIDGTEYTEI